MPSLEQILVSLQKITDDKKSQLTSLFEENSSWLQRELDAIRSLIEHNPRDHIPQSEKQRAEDNFGKKRKSPETALAPVKLSPEQKRALVDCDELLEKVGLPTDLNRLKKEQLLEELEKRGEMAYSMKNLKKDLIDGLKDLLIKIARSEKQEQICAVPLPIEVAPILEDRALDAILPPASSQELSSNSDDSARTNDAVMVVDSNPGLKTPGRKGSLMAEFRSMLNQQSTVTSTIDVQSEFHARQNRHRDSQLRKSQLQALPVGAESESSASVASSTATVMESVETATGSSREEARRPSVPDQSASLPPSGLQNTTSSIEEMAGQLDGASTEMETSTSAVEVEEDVSRATGQAAQLPTSARDQEVDAEQPPQQDGEEDGRDDEVEEVVEDEDKIWQEVTSDGEGDEETAPEAASATSLSSSAVPTTAASMPTASSLPSSAASISKPSNLITTSFTQVSSSSSSTRLVKPGTHAGPASFLDKPAPAKPVVAALEKARKAKEAEEQKALLKKKEQEQRKAAAAAAAPSTVATLQSSLTSTTGSTSSAKSTTSVKSNPSASTTTSATTSTSATTGSAANNAGGATKKTGGLFGGLFGKSTKETTTAATTASAPPAPATAAAVAAPVAAPVSQLSEGKKEEKMSKAAIQSIVHNYQAAMSPSPGPMPPPSSTPSKLFGMNLFSSPSKPTAGGQTSNTSSNAAPATGFASPTAAAPPAPALLSPVSKPIVATGGSTTTSTAASTAAASSLPPPPPSSSSSALPAHGMVTPAKTTMDIPAEEEYQIEDRASSDDDGSDSGTDEEGEEANKPQQKIPDWARGQLLKEALERQYGLHGHVPMDPDTIFPEVTTCSLEEIFGRSEGLTRKYHCRTSSAHWDADKLTLVEKRTYRQHMGYDKVAKAAKA